MTASDRLYEDAFDSLIVTLGSWKDYRHRKTEHATSDLDVAFAIARLIQVAIRLGKEGKYQGISKEVKP